LVEIDVDILSAHVAKPATQSSMPGGRLEES